MRLVADTNMIISMLFWGKSLERLFNLVNSRKVVLCFPPETIGELFRVVNYPHIQKQAQKLGVSVTQLIDKLISSSQIYYPDFKVGVVLEDESDNRLLEVAMVAEVMYLISGGKHLLKVGNFDGINICTPVKFFKLTSL